MSSSTLSRIRRGLDKPPAYIARRLAAEVQAHVERFRGPYRAGQFDVQALLRATRYSTLGELWDGLAAQPYLAEVDFVAPAEYERLCPGDADRIFRAAANALQHRVDLLGSGPIELGQQIDWHKDYKSGYGWPREYFRDIDYNNPERPSDVKFAWEVSRLQWVIPAGQAYLLTRDEKYAVAVRDLLEQWMAANPYGRGVNWACTMEAAIRIFTWTWLFHAFARSDSWAEPEFRARFLCCLFLHADFTQRHIEKADINGNHFTADAAALVVAGLFFGRGEQPQLWADEGWKYLQEELPRQVYPDGVDFEMSTAYHRLVMEFFLLAAVYRLQRRLDVPESYRQRLRRMADFVIAYTRLDGSSPLWGDADDARALPFGGQAVLDHRYLIGLVATFLDPGVAASASGPRHEVFWIAGADAVQKIPASERPQHMPGSSAFPDGGVYIMRNESDHVFIDCGPVGLAGRGGHGHNDILSFEAVLADQTVLIDCGSYVYTGSYEQRNLFRSTACHNTPVIDHAEVNRFVLNDDLWHLHNDALPAIRAWSTGPDEDKFQGSHSGYRRLSHPVTSVRTITLHHASHALTVRDDFEGEGAHPIEIHLHFAPEIEVCELEAGRANLRSQELYFSVSWDSNTTGWCARLADGRIAPSYGIAVPTSQLVFETNATLPAWIQISIRLQNAASKRGERGV